jgi:hypothetical protein
MGLSLTVALGMAAVLSAAVDATGTLEFRVRDAGGKPLPCRIHLTDEAGKPVKVDLPFWHDHFVCPGTAEVPLPPGTYAYEVERGPEYERLAGSVEVSEGQAARVEVSLNRLIDLPARGWFPGDLHVHRPSEDMELLLLAEDLYVAPVITWWNANNLWKDQPLPAQPRIQIDGGRSYDVMAGEDEREGGAFLYFHRQAPLSIAGAAKEWPSPLAFLAEASDDDETWIDIEKPFWWDVPAALAHGFGDSIGLANNHMCRSSMYETEAWGKPRDAERLPPPQGNGFWSQEIYYRILNSGLRIPPSAGSASGVLPNPVGYNRVYVHLDGGMDHAGWWEGLRAGRSFVTNGPLLLAKANGQLPGHVFSAEAGETVEMDVTAELVSRDPLAVIEIVRDGKVEKRLSPSEWRSGRSLGTLRFTESGWFLVRVRADVPHTFRFASTAPFHVEIGGKRRIDPASARFFLDWVRERIGRIKLDDPAQREEVLKWHRQAERFWQERLEAAEAQ